MFILVSIFLPIIIFIAPINVKAIQGNLDLSSAQTSVGKRFAKVFCDAKREGLDSDFASEYALNNKKPFSILFGPKIESKITNIMNISGEFKPNSFIKFFYSIYILVHAKNLI